MPSTVYKGDLTEISFGHETAVKLPTHFDQNIFGVLITKSLKDYYDFQLN